MAEETIQVTEQQVQEAATVIGFVRLGLGLTQYGAEERLTPELLQQTDAALNQAVAAMGKENVPRLLAEAATAASFHPPLTEPAQKITEADMVGILNAFVPAANLLAYAAQNPAAVVGTAPVGSAPSANAPAAAPAPSADVQETERLLTSFGINVGAVDGKRDGDFDKAVGDLKSLVFALAPTMQISRGTGLTENDLKLLEKGLSDFAASPECAALQEIRQGRVPAGLDKMDSMILGAVLKTQSTESGCLTEALKLKAKTDQTLALALQKVSPDVLNKLPQILDVISKQESRTALVKGLETAYATPVAAPVVPTVPAANQSAPSGAPVEQAPVAGAATDATSSDPAQTQTEQTAATSDVPTDADVEQSSIILESIMFEKMNDMLSSAAGPLQKFGVDVSQLLPVLEQADLEDKGSDGTSQEFGVKSQTMAATMIMAMKSFAGIKPPDGTYNEAIGHKLKMAILTGPESMDMVRGAFDLQPMDKKEAEEFLAKKEANKFNAFFNSLDTLHKAGKLDRDGVAKSVTMQNLMMDGLCTFLDKSEWGQKTKAWLKDFFENSEIGQMIGSVLSMFGINIGRLWGDKNDAAGIENAGKTVGRVFNGYISAAQKEMPAGTQFTAFPEEARALDEMPDNAVSVMGRVRKDIMEELDGDLKFQAGMQLIFGSADKETIKNAIDQALVEAGKKTTAADATEVFTKSLVELGKQYRNGEEIDFNKVAALLNEAQGFAANEAQQMQAEDLQKQADDLQNRQIQEGATLAQPSSPEDDSLVAPPDAGSTSSTVDPSTTAPQSVRPNALTGTVDSNNIPADVAGNKIEAGNQDLRFVYVRDPKDYIQKDIPSNGRVRDVLDVISRNSEGLKMSLDMGMIKDAGGAVIDKATKPACAILEELSIRAHVAQQLRNLKEGESIDLAKIDRKMDSANDVYVISSYLKESGVSDPDIAKFRKAAEALIADRTVDRAFVNTPQVKLVEVKEIVRQAQEARDPNAVQVNPEDAHLYELYKDWNARKGKGPNSHCLPLVVMGREEGGKIITIDQDRAANREVKLDKNGNPEGYKVFVGIVDNNRDKIPTNDVFKVLEVKDFMANGMRIDMDDPSYNALVKNYTWSDGDKSHYISNFIKDQLCLKTPVVSLDQSDKLQAKAEQPAASQEKTASAETSAVHGANAATAYRRPPIRNYDDMLHEDRLLSDKQSRELDGGRLNLEVEYAKVAKSVDNAAAMGTRQAWVVNPAYSEGPFMLTKLTDPKDQAEFGGDFIVSRMINGVLYNSVIDTKKDNIVHPDTYKNGEFFAGSGSIREIAERSLGRGNAPTGLDELLDSNLGSEHRDNFGVPFKHMVMLVQQSNGNYRAENALSELSGVNAEYRKVENLPYDLNNPAGTPPDREELAKAQSRESAYEQEFVRRAYERRNAEGQLLSANTKEFGNVSGVSDSDRITMALENSRDIGTDDYDAAANMGGLTAQQRKSMSFSANVG